MRRFLFVILILWGIILCSCRGVATPELLPPPTPATFSQWAVSGQASSNFGFPDWSVNRATGAPDVDVCADDSRAWASAQGNGLQWLLMDFAEPVYATEVQVYQTFGRGAISRISLIDVDGNSVVVWEDIDTSEPCPGSLVVDFPPTESLIQTVRIDLDESRTGFWNEIDAVALIGLP